MYRSLRRARRRTAALALATAVVTLTTGLGTPAGATPPGAAGPAEAGRATAPLKHVTLITGDRVSVDAEGRPVRIERGEGREKIPVWVRVQNGRTLAVPADAERLIATGKLDRRLFDLTELTRPETLAAQRGGLKVIVQYSGSAATARSEVREAEGSAVRRTFGALNAEAVQTPAADAGALWSALTDTRRAAVAAPAPGISRVWLDGGRRASLDKSVAQIGAPKAWAGGYDGTGVTIAVLDTGVDATHPDLAGRVVAERNFSSAADAEDRQGHGTHVASTAAGTGARSGGAHKGVAPGAKLLSGKVLDDDGFGSDSQILAGIEWAVAQGADIVNLSLGSTDTPELDPLEAAVNQISADKGVLFAVAAGNSGSGASTVESPGSAEAALTVGAVDDSGALADFSSRGPRTGDGGVKPDVTAPGVDITAAAAPGSALAERHGQSPDGYLTISGTSMATPHVAGAAAVLKQRNPHWTYAELKGALTGSTDEGPYGLLAGGTGRVRVDAALEQTVFAQPAALNFGVAQWPHADDPVQTEKVTYRNTGDEPVTLALTLDVRDPRGEPGPDGLFTLGADTVTVPAGGTASVDLSADTRLGGTLDGLYSVQVLAVGDGQGVRTPAVVEREVESYDVTFDHVGRDGQAAASYGTSVRGVTEDLFGKEVYLSEESATDTVRLPKGTYFLESHVDGSETGTNWLVQPVLDVTGTQTVTLDARAAKPVDITVPDRDAAPESAVAVFSYQQGDFGQMTFLAMRSFAGLRTAHLGPAVTSGLTQLWSGVWTNGPKDYRVTLGGGSDRFTTGVTRHLGTGDMAAVRVGLGASAPGKSGFLFPTATVPDAPPNFFAPSSSARELPTEQTLYLSTLDGARWDMGFQQMARSGDGWATEVSFAPEEPKEYRGGQTYHEVFNTAVIGPLVDARYGLSREGDEISGDVPLFSDGRGHAGRTLHTSARTTLHRDGVKIAESDAPIDRTPFTVPAGDARYRLSTSVTRDPAVAAASTRIDASWEFRSRQTTTATRLPVSTVRFGAAVGLDGTVPARHLQLVPLTVQGAAAGGNLKSLAVYASYDDGKSWTALTVVDGRAVVRNPDQGKAISLRALVVDKQGNRSSLDVHQAYRGR
ncbi:S8 family peptidase [Streptomyces sp. TRM76323]|uniref:S8 family peptidase n=1 Tax=Streptomyces tamarix TaxID=3078565 RepID=A0ABU3QF26_9ACTN|nr:S8 family peptidase [Streptomyces tamarix]MDT9680977.1 S8 family peptidase [Streptomyces tamarix]